MPEFAWLQQNVAYPARQVRTLVSELFGEGVIDLSGGSLAVSERSAGANMSVDVAAGRCVVVGDEQADQETYLCVFDDATNLAVASADPDQARKDRVIVRVRDSAVSGSTDGPVREVLTGTPGSGSAPAVPDSAISLAIIDVAAGTPSITDADITDDRAEGSLKPHDNTAHSGDGFMPRDGSQPATAAIDAGSNKVTNVTDPTANQDAATKSYVDGANVESASDTYTGDGATTQTVSVGFTPKFVSIVRDTSTTLSAQAEAGFTPSTTAGISFSQSNDDISHHTDFKIVSGGFQVPSKLNGDGSSYQYVAYG